MRIDRLLRGILKCLVYRAAIVVVWVLQLFRSDTRILEYFYVITVFGDDGSVRIFHSRLEFWNILPSPIILSYVMFLMNH